MNEIQILINKLNYYTKCYDEGHPEISDQDWDRLYFQLVDLENTTGLIYPNSPTQTIHYEVANILSKVKHNHKMLSLDKTKDWDTFIEYFNNRDKCLMLKLDGLTCSLTYENGELISAETRGNGIMGEDVLHNIKIMSSVPMKINYNERLVIDGEIISTYDNFTSFQETYANPRNFASGSIRLLNAQEFANRGLIFVVWNIINGFDNDNSFISKLQQIQDLGFITVPWVSDSELNAKEYLVKQAKQLSYPIDGLVGRFDDIKYGNSLGETGHHAKAAYAFKFYDTEYETSLIDIEWSLGRTGVFTPIAVFKPIDTGDSIIERASVHNLSILYEITGGGARVGDTLTVFKANEIIPQISNWENDGTGAWIPLLETCPICGQPVTKTTSDAGIDNLVCQNVACEGKLINILDHFCGKSGLDIKGISKATLEKLINWGWLNDISDIFNLKEHRAAWISKPGFGIKSVDRILDNIETSLHTTTLQQFIVAIGIPLIGVAQSKILSNKFNTWDNLYDAIKNKYDFTQIDTFGENKTYELWNYDYSLVEKLIPLFTGINSMEEKSSETILTSLNCQNLTFCITGKLNHYKNRDALVTEIEKMGGKVVSSVSAKTSFLINNDNTSQSAKNKSAHRLNVPVITEEEWISTFV